MSLWTVERGDGTRAWADITGVDPRDILFDPGWRQANRGEWWRYQLFRARLGLWEVFGFIVIAAILGGLFT